MSQSPATEPRWKRNTAYVKPEDILGEGDTTLIKDFLPESLAQRAFEELKKQVAWQTMYHHGGEVPRRVAVEGEVLPDGWFPIYRHPSDQSPPLLPFSACVSEIRRHVEETLGHPVNHVLIQHYRSGNDYISEHSDKTIDVVHGSSIVNVSIGAQRVMVLRQKKDSVISARQAAGDDSTGPIERPAQRVPLPNNSLFVLGLQTNAKWLHSIRQDKRIDSMKSEDELAFGGERISLTFRHIGTWLSADSKLIYGQGATGKTKEEAKAVINGDAEAAQNMIDAFGFENQQSNFKWDETYGNGFDVLHFTNLLSASVVPSEKTEKPLLHYVNGSVPSWRVHIALREKGIGYDQKRLKVMTVPKETRTPEFLSLNPRGKAPVLVDGDIIITESLAILLYIDEFYPGNRPLLPPTTDKQGWARTFARIQETEKLRAAYERLEDSHFDAANGVRPALTVLEREQLVTAVWQELDYWEEYASQGIFIAGDSFSLADCAFFPALGCLLRRGFQWSERWPDLQAYYSRVWSREGVKSAQPEGWEGRGRANVFKGTKGGAQPIFRGHTSPTKS